jgi:hypothetical protein
VNDIETQADVEREWPGWRVWAGSTDGMFHGVRSSETERCAALTADGESWQDLSDEIRRSESKLAQNLYTGTRLGLSPDGRGSL